MKKFCSNCGDDISYMPRKTFCSKACCHKFHHGDKPRNIRNFFSLFKAIVNASNSYEELSEYYNHYFKNERR